MTINLTRLSNHFMFSTKAYQLALDVLDRFDSIDEDIYENVESIMMWTENKWKLMMAYQTPEEADYDKAYDLFVDDLESAINDGALEEDDD